MNEPQLNTESKAPASKVAEVLRKYSLLSFLITVTVMTAILAVPVWLEPKSPPCSETVLREPGDACTISSSDD